MKRILLAVVGCLSASFLLRAQDLSQRYASYGQLIVTQLTSAPFPHPKRADGHKYKDESYSADKHYHDSTVAIFVPKGFRETNKVDFVVHFHGWRNSVTNVLRQYQLIEQFVESGRNAILVVPQGPRDAPDSFGGNLEDAEGFKRFMSEVIETLREKGAIKKAEIGNMILSGHSGGYQVISSILARGGLIEHVREVWLFDALYAQTEKFTDWFDHQHGRLINIYTEHGGTKGATEKLMADLKQRGTAYLAKTELEVLPQDLRTNRLVFLFTELAHDDVLDKHRTFREFLQTSGLTAIGGAGLIVPPPRREVPGRRSALPLGTLYIPDFFKPATNGIIDLVLFFHGAAWCAEQNFYDARKNAVLVAVSHTNYAAIVGDPKRFQTLLDSITNTLARERISAPTVGRICLASFSGGYAAVREVLKQPEFVNQISDVVLGDSLYAPRLPGKTNQLDPAAMAPFLNYALRAADGKGHFWFSQLYPPEERYRDNTTTLAANYLIDHLKIERRDPKARNSRGVRILYRADRGNFHVFGYAGMSNQDHFEHFYGFSDLLRETSLDPAATERTKD